MSSTSQKNQIAEIQQKILSQCRWSENFQSIKQILKQTTNQLPLFVTFDDAPQQTILFFDRYSSKKLFLTPFQQRQDQPEKFDRLPEHCTFLLSNFYKGLFEFVVNGRRCARICSTLDELIQFSSDLKSTIVFISRDQVTGYYQDASSSTWMNKNYPQGAIFRAKCIHHSSTYSGTGEVINNDYLGCLDEDGDDVLLKMNQLGRYSLVATSNEQRETQPEIYLHSTQAPKINLSIQRIASNYKTSTDKIYLRLVRGNVPQNFYGQYFQFVCQQTLDTLVGLTKEGLVVEWNIPSHSPCRYATNLNEILKNVQETTIEKNLGTIIQRARFHYRDNFQMDMQIGSTRDWTGFVQYWKWIGDIQGKYQKKIDHSNQSDRNFHLIASLQDLSTESRSLVSIYKKHHFPRRQSSHRQENQLKEENKSIGNRQNSFVAGMSKLILSPAPISKQRHSNGPSVGRPRTASLLLPTDARPFDDSNYESNQKHFSPLLTRQ